MNITLLDTEDQVVAIVDDEDEEYVLMDVLMFNGKYYAAVDGISEAIGESLMYAEVTVGKVSESDIIAQYDGAA